MSNSKTKSARTKSARTKSVSGTLATATVALLGSAPSSPVQAQEVDKWDFNTALMYYGENNRRVRDVSASVLASKEYVDDRSLTLGITVDSLTGATPSGAITQGVPQTFTRPSGNATYTIPAGELPLDDTFRDTRLALTASWTQPWGRLNKLTVGGSASKEYDYLHLGVNAGIARDFNNRNTTLSASFAFSKDTFEPVGGTPDALSLMLDVGDLSNRGGDQDKDVLDVVLGVTQVISRNLITQFNYSYSDNSGYLTDPYKLVSVVDGVSGDTVLRTPPVAPDVGPSHLFRFENRPDNRAKHSVYGQAKLYMDGRVLDASYRYMSDDWDIDSHTVDIRYRWPIGDNSYIEPHVRWYTQTEAEFYRVSVVDGQPLPTYASADYRLGNFDGLTLGAKYGWKTRSGNEMSVRAELYSQTGDIPSSLLFGNQVGQVSYPDMDAVIVQFSYKFDR